MKDVIVALDFKNKDETLQFLKPFTQPIYTKVGMELFYREGPPIVREIKAMGHKVFLDLKLHDIPNTVGKATKSLMTLNVDMINIHIAGGSNMIEAFVHSCKESENPPLMIGVTMLTSTDRDVMNSELLIPGEVSETVESYAKLGEQQGLDGVVCSALEVPKIKEIVSQNFLTVTPGIRPMGFQKDDQARIVTPNEAAILGSDYIVVGRPITKSQIPKLAYDEIRTQFIGGER